MIPPFLSFPFPSTPLNTFILINIFRKKLTKTRKFLDQKKDWDLNLATLEQDVEKYKQKAIKFEKLHKNDRNILEHLKITNVQQSAQIFGIETSSNQEISKLESRIIILEEEIENLRISNIELTNEK